MFQGTNSTNDIKFESYWERKDFCLAFIDGNYLIQQLKKEAEYQAEYYGDSDNAPDYSDISGE